MINEDLHPQNWHLEVKRGTKGSELGLDGLATSIDELKNQLDQANQALNRVKADRADMDDQPQLGEGSSVKIEDLPVADDVDKANMDSEVAKAQEKVGEEEVAVETEPNLDKLLQNVDTSWKE